MHNYLANHIIDIYSKKRLKILHGIDFNYHKNGEELSVKAILTLREVI